MNNYTIDDYLPDLEEKLGTITSAEECCPGVYYIEVDAGGRFHKEYYVLMDDAPFTGQIWNYGVWFKDMYLFEVGKYASGWEVMQYEVTKYHLAAGKETVPEEVFHDRAIHAMDAYEEYFGSFPVPCHTPEGCTLRHRSLGNGVYWLETSRGKELLSVCFPIWESELSSTAKRLGRLTETDRVDGTISNLFFSRESSCVPMYELMMTRQEWDGTVIRRPALMNALWEYAPEYAIRQADGKHMIGMFPGEGTDFLLLK